MKIKSITFIEEKCVLLLNIEEFIIPRHINQYARDASFILKQEFHITIIGNQEGKRLLQNLSTEKCEILKHEVEKMDWSFNLLDKFYHIRKKYGNVLKESIIQIIDISSIDTNLRVLSEKLGVVLHRPFLHVSLFVKNDAERHGIGINSPEDFLSLGAKEIFENSNQKFLVDKVYLPSRIQIDTIVAIFLIQNFGKHIYENVGNADFEIVAVLDDGETYDSLLGKGILAIDHAQGPFDHHNQPVKITSSRLVASYLNISDDPAISKMLALAERCDFYGRGTISDDVLDKTFGLSGIITMLNQQYQSEPKKIYDVIYPILDAHYKEERHKIIELPQEVNSLNERGAIINFSVLQRDRKIKVSILTSDDPSMSSYLRSSAGGLNDVVAQWLSSGHVNIITRQMSKVDLVSLMAIIRKSEMMLTEIDSESFDMKYLASVGRIKELPQWYFDNGTNTIQNGGINPGKIIMPTKIPKDTLVELIKLGLSEKLWSPLS